MVDQLVVAFQFLLSATCLTVVWAWIVHLFPAESPRRLWTAWGVGLVLGILTAALLGTSVLRGREVVNAWIQGSSLVFGTFLILGLGPFAAGTKPLDDYAKGPFRRLAVLAVTVLLVLVPGFLLAGAKALGTSQMALSSDTLVVALVLAAGVALALVGGRGLVLLVRRARPGLVWFVVFGILGLGMTDQLLSILQVLATQGPLAKVLWFKKVLIVLSPYQSFLGTAQVVFLLLVPLSLLFQPAPAVEGNPSAPVLRKRRAQRRSEVRWAGAVVGLFAVAGLFVRFGWLLNEAPVIISEAVPVEARDGAVRLDLAPLSDGDLHRFVYPSQDGTDVRFIVIQKAGATFGVGLDACDVCGPTGYFQRQGQVICRLCDVQMNKATIGFPGGCNPVPLAYTIDGGRLVIQAQTLEAEAPRFR